MASKTDKPFYYIAGSGFFQDQKIKEILSGFEDCETETFGAEDLGAGSFFNFINTAPLFSETKAAVVRSFDSLSQPEKMAAECGKCIESAIILLADETKISKKLSDALTAAGFNTITEPKATKYDLTAQIIRMFTQAGFTIDTSAAAEINELFSGNMALITSEINKLTAFFAYKKPSSQTDILNAITARKHDTVFSFIDAFTVRKKKECAVMLDDFIKNDENLNVLIVLLFRRMKDVKLMSVARDMVKENRPFILEKINSGCRAWNRQSLISILGLFAELDYMMKTGQISDAGFLTRLIGAI